MLEISINEIIGVLQVIDTNKQCLCSLKMKIPYERYLKKINYFKYFFL